MSWRWSARFKKSRPHLRTERLARYRLIDEERAHLPVWLLCRMLRVARSAYQEYRRGRSHGGGTRKAALGKRVKAFFYDHRRRYGARRIAAELKATGCDAGRYAVRSQMQRLGLRAIRARAFVPHTPDSRHAARVSPNRLLDEQNVARQPREVVVGDITYLPRSSGKGGYLASWQDKFSKRRVGWAVAARLTEALVREAFARAGAAGGGKAQTIVHTDRASPYVSNDFRALRAANGWRQRLARRGNCYDNAQAERLFSRYKAELPEDGMFEHIEQARRETFS